MQFEATDQTPNPSLVAGATIWLKNNAIAIGVITMPSLMNVTLPPPPLPPSPPPPPPSPPSPPPLPPSTPVGPGTTFTCHYWDQEEYSAIQQNNTRAFAIQECTNSGNYNPNTVVNGVSVSCGNCNCCKALLPPPSPPPPPSLTLPPVGPTTKFVCYYWSTVEYDAVHSGSISTALECTNAGYYAMGSTINGITVSCGSCACCQQAV